MFLEAASVTTQFSFGASAGAAYGYQSLARENSVIDGRVLIEEKPTVTYQPLQGKEFVEKVLTRIPLDTLVLLDGSGWSTERVFRVCVERMNDLRNAISADGPTPGRNPAAGAPGTGHVRRRSHTARGAIGHPLPSRGR